MNERDVRGNCRPGKRNAAQWSSDGLPSAEPPAPPDSTRSERTQASYHHNESFMEKINTSFCCSLCVYLSTLQHVPFVHDLQRVHLLSVSHPGQSHLRIHTSVHIHNHQQKQHKHSHLAEGSSADHLQDVKVIPAYSSLLHLSDQRLRWHWQEKRVSIKSTNNMEYCCDYIINDSSVHIIILNPSSSLSWIRLTWVFTMSSALRSFF